MSGGISFKKGVYWGKAGWCYRTARDGICETLRGIPNGSALAEELSAESHPAQWCEHLEIDEWPKEKKKLFFEAIYRCVDHFAREGPAAWRNPSCYPGFLRALEELAKTAHDVEAEDENN